MPFSEIPIIFAVFKEIRVVGFTAARLRVALDIILWCEAALVYLIRWSIDIPAKRVDALVGETIVRDVVQCLYVQLVKSIQFIWIVMNLALFERHLRK